ncbi:MAG: ABC transporter ATP-binding protein [Erysipelotrichaceae bacterium]|nr:ABC transporter ATP-binding protein [Erysipelotrichaceae bacterium]
MLKRFISYYKPYKKLFIEDMIASFLVSLTAMIYPVITRNMLNDFIPNKKYKLMIIFGISLLVIYIIRGLLKYFVQYYGHYMGVYMQSDMRKDLFKKIEQLPLKYFDDNETGSIMSRLTNDLFDISELAHHGPENLIMCTLMIILSFVYLLTINVKLTLIIFCSIPFLVIISLRLRNYMVESSRKSKRAIAAINADISSSISGIRVTKAFNNSDIELEKFEKSNDSFVEARKMHFRGFSIFNSATSFITDLFNVIVLIAGGIFLFNGEITFGDYSTFIVSVTLFLDPINRLIQFTEQFQEGITGFERFVEIIDLPIEEDKKDAKEIKKINGDIEFKNVTFAYDHNEEEKEILDNVSFNVKKGKTVALVGPSGGGKTTICHLLPKFYHVDEGEITINGINIEDIKMSSLRENIGIVQQDVFLFSGTFYENILYGKTDATKKEVIEAAKKANIYDYIMSLPKGFDTEIGERGIRLSGGQKQRLSIARVFLKNPSILILDEATSALDNVTEVLIQEALNTLKKGRTTIVVAHRLSTIKNANEILVVSNGKIVEKGTHNSLIRKPKSIYKELYKSQFKESNSNLDKKMMMR